MNMGKTIADLDISHSVPDGSLHIVRMGDGTGTKAVPHGDVVKAVASSLSIGDIQELETEEKGSFVGALNEIIEKLAIVGITYKGKYVSGTAYENLDAVYNEQDGSSYVALKDNPVGIPNADGVNWQYLAKGFLDGLLVAKSQIVNNLLATVPGNVLDAMQGKALKGMIDQINSNMTKKADTANLPRGFRNINVNTSSDNNGKTLDTEDIGWSVYAGIGNHTNQWYYFTFYAYGNNNKSNGLQIAFPGLLGNVPQWRIRFNNAWYDWQDI